jgi:alanine dehydrogenase
MEIGVPRESPGHEHRVGLTPFGVARLKDLGCHVLVQDGAGRDSHFTSEDYAGAGAVIVYQAGEVFGRADLVCKIGRPTAAEVRLMRPGAAVAGFMHLAVMPAETIRAVEETEATVIGYETRRRRGWWSPREGSYPSVLHATEHALTLAPRGFVPVACRKGWSQSESGRHFS